MLIGPTKAPSLFLNWAKERKWNKKLMGLDEGETTHQLSYRENRHSLGKSVEFPWKKQTSPWNCKLSHSYKEAAL